MKDIRISIFASAIRPRLWDNFMESLKTTTEEYEVIFSGPVDSNTVSKFLIKHNNLRFIQTGNIKPAQCYEVARQACRGETISWSADDCEYSPDCFGKAYRFWKSMNNEKVALSIQTVEDGYKYNMHNHSFVGFDNSNGSSGFNE
jgi:hypothetical protein